MSWTLVLEVIVVKIVANHFKVILGKIKVERLPFLVYSLTFRFQDVPCAQMLYWNYCPRSYVAIAMLACSGLSLETWNNNVPPRQRHPLCGFSWIYPLFRSWSHREVFAGYNTFSIESAQRIQHGTTSLRAPCRTYSGNPTATLTWQPDQ